MLELTYVLHTVCGHTSGQKLSHLQATGFFKPEEEAIVV